MTAAELPYAIYQCSVRAGDILQAGRPKVGCGGRGGMTAYRVSEAMRVLVLGYGWMSLRRGTLGAFRSMALLSAAQCRVPGPKAIFAAQVMPAACSLHASLVALTTTTP